MKSKWEKLKKAFVNSFRIDSTKGRKVVKKCIGEGIIKFSSSFSYSNKL